MTGGKSGGSAPRPSRRLRRGLNPARALALLLLLLLTALPAAARSFHISNFHASLHLAEDGSMTVTERITLVFLGSWNGIYRSIPVEYPGPRGTNYRLLVDFREVKDAEGNPLRFEVLRAGKFRELKIYIPGARDATRTLEITYHVRNGIRFFPTHDELYWNVTGNDWEVPIHHASAWVFLPRQALARAGLPAAEGVRAQAFTGVYGSAERAARAELRGHTVEFETHSPLPMRGGLTANVYLPKGVLREPGFLTRAGWFLQGNPIVLLPLVAFAVMFGLWHWKGRDPDVGLSVSPQYEPPAGLTPAEAGALVDDRVDPRDITATLVDLAVRGFLRIEETRERQLLFNKRDYVLHRLKPHTEWDGEQMDLQRHIKDDGLAAHERIMMSRIFALGGDRMKVSDLREEFYTAIPRIKKQILAALHDKGVYRVDPEKAWEYRLLGLGLIVAPFILAEYLGWASFFQTGWWVAALAIALAALIVVLFGRKMTAKTHRGMKTYIAVRGFQEFMARVEADRLRRMPPDTFEKFLPFAMALGVEEHWGKAFAGLVREPPRWYSGGDMRTFTPMRFTHALQSMSRTTHSAFVAAPRSSSSGSGFGGGGGGGGGFSGGGFGGGGGRGF